MNRIDKANWSGHSPMIAPPAIQYELADRFQAFGAGGLGVIQRMVKQFGLAENINRICPIFKMYLPYSEAEWRSARRPALLPELGDIANNCRE